MFNTKALLALLVLLFSGSAAFAQPLSDVATYTNWSLANSVNPFYTDGRKGITHEEAARLPVGTLIALPNGTTHALKRGETVWQIDREYAASVQSANAPTPHVQRTARASAVKAAGLVINTPALERAKIQARYEAERHTALLAEEANALRVEADTNLTLASGAMDAALAATKKREALEQAGFAATAATAARTTARRAHNVATVAETTANTTDSAKAHKSAAEARAAANAALVSATKAETLAKRARAAPNQWVMDWPPTITLGVIGFLLMYTAITSLVFQFLPNVFNFMFKGGVSTDGVLNVPIKVLAIPAFLVGAAIERQAFYEQHYPYLYPADKSPDEDDDETVEHNPAMYVDETDLVPDENEPGIEEERRFSPYPTDERIELRHVLH